MGPHSKNHGQSCARRLSTNQMKKPLTAPLIFRITFFVRKWTKWHLWLRTGALLAFLIHAAPPRIGAHYGCAVIVFFCFSVFSLVSLTPSLLTVFLSVSLQLFLSDTFLTRLDAHSRDTPRTLCHRPISFCSSLSDISLSLSRCLGMFSALVHGGCPPCHCCIFCLKSLSIGHTLTRHPMPIITHFDGFDSVQKKLFRCLCSVYVLKICKTSKVNYKKKYGLSSGGGGGGGVNSSSEPSPQLFLSSPCFEISRDMVFFDFRSA